MSCEDPWPRRPADLGRPSRVWTRPVVALGRPPSPVNSAQAGGAPCRWRGHEQAIGACARPASEVCDGKAVADPVAGARPARVPVVQARARAARAGQRSDPLAGPRREGGRAGARHAARDRDPALGGRRRGRRVDRADQQPQPARPGRRRRRAVAVDPARPPHRPSSRSAARSPPWPRSTASCSPPACARPATPCSAWTTSRVATVPTAPPSSSPPPSHDWSIGACDAMSGSFSSLSTALSALRYQRVVMDVANSNIANVSTEGYSRRRVEGASVGAPSVPAMWSRYDGYGDGVRVSGREPDDRRAAQRAQPARARVAGLPRRAADLPGAAGQRDRRAGRQRRLRLPGPKFRASWHDLANSPDTAAARAQVLSAATGVVDAVKTQAGNVANEAERPALPAARRRQRGEHARLRPRGREPGDRRRQPGRERRGGPPGQAGPAHAASSPSSPAATSVIRSDGGCRRVRRRRRPWSPGRPRSPW